MKLIDTFLLRALLVPLIYCLAAFTMVYVVYDLFDHLSNFIKAGTEWSDVLKFYVFLLPSVLIYIVPISLLLAILYSLAQLTKNNELTAMRASGVSLYRLLLPFVTVGLLCTLVVGYVNERIGPGSAYWCSRFLQLEKAQGNMNVNIIRDHPFKNELFDRIWMIETFNADTFEMNGIFLTQERADGSRQIEYKAESAFWMDSTWWFRKVSIQHYDKNNNPRRAPIHVTVREMTELSETPKDFRNEIKYNQEFMSAKELASFVRTRPNLSDQTLARYLVDYHYRLAMPWTCFVVTLLGIPLGRETGRSGAFLGIFSSISMFFLLYIAINVGLALGKNGAVAPWLASWGPIGLFSTIGALLLYRMR